MEPDLLELFDRASDWCGEKVDVAVASLDAPTPCDGWDVRTLVSHMVQTQEYFAASARGEEASPPAGDPSSLLGDDAATEFGRARAETRRAFAQPGAIDRTGPALGIAFADQLLHGWDIAQATGQDATMPDGLAAAAYDLIHGQFADDQRQGVFDPEIAAPSGASAQESLLAYTGRDPSR